jgi:hypothetical protein
MIHQRQASNLLFLELVVSGAWNWLIREFLA